MRRVALAVTLLFIPLIAYGIDKEEIKMILKELLGDAIVAFEADECPGEYWKPFTKAEGRFLIGSTDEIRYGTEGGTSVHNHIGTTGQGGAARGVDSDNDHSTSSSDHRHNFSTSTVDFLPPYVSVTFCRLK